MFTHTNMAQESGHSSTQNIITNRDAVIALTDIRRFNHSNTHPALTPRQLYAILPLSIAHRSIRLLDLNAAPDDTRHGRRRRGDCRFIRGRRGRRPHILQPKLRDIVRLPDGTRVRGGQVAGRRTRRERGVPGGWRGCWGPILLINSAASRGGTEEEEENPAPSWVPDWAPVARVRGGPGLFTGQRIYRPHEQSFATSRWPAWADVDGDKLRVAGARVGRVGFSSGRFAPVLTGQTADGVLQLSDTDPLLWGQMATLAAWVLYCRRNPAAVYESVPYVMFRVLRGPGSGPGRQRERNEFDSAYRVLSGVDSGVVDGAGAGVVDAVRRHFWEVEDGLFSLNLAMRYINQYLAERRALFTIERGFIGAGATGVRVGDRLALIAGVSVPMVLWEKRGRGGDIVCCCPAGVCSWVYGEWRCWDGEYRDDYACVIVLLNRRSSSCCPSDEKGG